MRAQAEWKVITHITRETPPTSRSTRSFISPAALLVKVIAQDLARQRLASGEQVGDPVGEDAGLAGAGAGEHQKRALAVGDRLALRLVQLREQALDLRCARVYARGQVSSPWPPGRA